ncbi:MAG: glycosyltransferase family 2 protein [Gemmatimonadaceae bacterium]
MRELVIVDDSAAPLVSIIMAAYNAEKTLGRALESMHAQTFADWELIVVDDASTDTTPEILAAWKGRDDRIIVVRNQANKRQGAAANRGFALSRGKLIARMDSDDWSAPTRLEQQVLFLDAHPEIDILGTAATLVTPSGRDCGLRILSEDHTDLYKARFRGGSILNPTAIMRRQVIETLGGYDEKLPRGEDAEYWLRAFRAGFKFHNLDEPLLQYTLRPPTARDLWFGGYVLLRACRRERLLLSQSMNALRFVGGGVLTRLKQPRES